MEEHVEEAVIYDCDADGVVTLTLNRPELRNPISDAEMVQAILEALDRLESDPAARVAILTGAGKGFSSGGNVRDMLPGGKLNTGEPISTRHGYRHGIQQLPLAFSRLEIPVIAAVNGPAIGAGCDLACMCDLRIASQSAKIGRAHV